MHPTFEISYLAIGVREVPYIDWMTVTVANQGAGGTVNALLTNGLLGLRRLTVFPTASPSSSDNTWLPVGMPVYHSPFSGALCNGDSGINLGYIGQFQVQVAGCNVLTQQHRYTYEHWIQEMGCSGVQYGLNDGICSGLLSKAAWEMAPVYTCDLSRMSDSERTAVRSVQLQGVNLSTCGVDYICFLEFDQTGLKLDLLSGQRVS